MKGAGRLIAVEGLDGSGKATQTAALTAWLQAQGEAVRQVAFPDYQSESSALVRLYLNGAFGSDPSAVNAYAASSFYAVDRYASYRRSWGAFYAQGGTVIADRYTTSNAIHQCAKLPQRQWNDFLDWLFHYEYELLGLPAPAQTVYLRVDPAVSQGLLTKRYAGDEGKKDIHEADTAYLTRARAAADYCAGRLGWTVVECCTPYGMRAPQEITQEIICRLFGGRCPTP